MKKKIIVCCAFVILFVIVIVTGHFLLKPIAKVGNDTVIMYDFIRYTFSDKQFILERMAENVAFNRLVKEANVTVSDTEIQTELNALENKTDISYKTCQKSILQQKVIEKYASEIKVTAENARQYYEDYKWRYSETEPEFETVKTDMQMEMGVAKYEERLSRLKEDCKVSILE